MSSDMERIGFVGGRTAARIHTLADFDEGDIEVLLSRANRGVRSVHRLDVGRAAMGLGAI